MAKAKKNQKSYLGGNKNGRKKKFVINKRKKNKIQEKKDDWKLSD